jgi:hypothetical protein
MTAEGAQTTPEIKKPQAFAHCGLPGSKMHSYENARPAGPGTSKIEPKISHWGVSSLVPGEEHAGCCETTTALRANNSLRLAQRAQGLYA